MDTCIDTNSVDTGSVNGGSVDTGSVNGGSVNGGSVDTGSVDTGSVDNNLATFYGGATPTTQPIVFSTYYGNINAVLAVGGYNLVQSLPYITLEPQVNIEQYNVTNSVQVLFDVRTFNAKLGLFKDASNINITSTSYDKDENMFNVESISLDANEFVGGLSESQIISVGSYSSIYSDFVYYVKTYFSWGNGFATLFKNINKFNINNGIFDAQAFMNIISGRVTSPSLDGGRGGSGQKLSGSIIINQVNEVLRNILDRNAFGNRDVHVGTTASDSCNRANYGVNDGFLDGDLIFVPNGTTTILYLGISPELFVDPINNIGVKNVSQLNQTTNFMNGYFSQNTIATLTSITRTIRVPLLIRLTNLS